MSAQDKISQIRDQLTLAKEEVSKISPNKNTLSGYIEECIILLDSLSGNETSLKNIHNNE